MTDNARIESLEERVEKLEQKNQKLTEALEAITSYFREAGAVDIGI